VPALVKILAFPLFFCHAGEVRMYFLHGALFRYFLTTKTMKKVIIFSFSSIFLLMVFLQTPFLLNQQVQAVDCTCNQEGIAGANYNGYTCTDGYKGSCSDSYSKNGGSDADGCVTAQANTIYTLPARCSKINTHTGQCIGQTTPSITYQGVACTNNPSQVKLPNGQNAISCQCGDTNGKDKQNVYCYNNTKLVNGKPDEYKQSCGSDSTVKKCVSSTNIFTDAHFPSGTVNAVRGAACVAQCTCDKNGVVGQNNNSWTCANGSGDGPGACHNLEDKCVDSATPIPLNVAPFGPTTGNGTDPSDWKSVSCVNSTNCSCNGSQIVCIAKNVKLDPDGNPLNEYYSYDCGDNLCGQNSKPSDPDYTNIPLAGIKAFNQVIPNIGCYNPITGTPLNPPSPPCGTGGWQNGECTSFDSAFGAIETDPAGFIKTIFGILLSASGGIALLLIIRSGYQLMTSQGNPEQVKNGRDQLIAAIVGLVFLIFAFVFLQLIGFDILKIPGFGGGTGTGNGASQQSCAATGEQYCSSTQSCYPVSSTCPAAATPASAQSCAASGEQYCSSTQSCYPVSSTCP